MKPFQLLTPILALIVTSSCVRYQYMSVNSDLPKKNGVYSHENDTCLVSYRFNGENCPIVINIHNKLDSPLFLSWRKSSISIFHDTISLWDESSGEENREPISKIAPLSSIEIKPLDLITKFVTLSASDPFVREQVMTANGKVEMKRFVFDTLSTPLHFKCKLYYSTIRDKADPQQVNDQFWVSTLIDTFSHLPLDQPDVFYLQKSTGFSSFAGILVLTGLLVFNYYLPGEAE